MRIPRALAFFAMCGAGTALASGCALIFGIEEAHVDPNLCPGPGYAIVCPPDGGGGGGAAGGGGAGGGWTCTGPGCVTWSHVWGDGAVQEPLGVAVDL